MHRKFFFAVNAVKLPNINKTPYNQTVLSQSAVSSQAGCNQNKFYKRGPSRSFFKATGHCNEQFTHCAFEVRIVHNVHFKKTQNQCDVPNV